jgi:hypothetical protein
MDRIYELEDFYGNKYKASQTPLKVGQKVVILSDVTFEEHKTGIYNKSKLISHIPTKKAKIFTIKELTKDNRVKISEYGGSYADDLVFQILE